MSIISVADFLAAHPNKIFVKCLNRDFVHYGLSLTEGLNVAPSFDDDDAGLFFTTIEFVNFWIEDYDGPVAFVSFPPEARICMFSIPSEFKTDRFILSDFTPREEFCRRYFIQNPALGSYYPETIIPDIDMMRASITFDINNIEYFPTNLLLSDMELVRTCIAKEPELIYYIPPEVCLTDLEMVKSSLKENPYSILHLSPDVLNSCLDAVREAVSVISSKGFSLPERILRLI